MAGKNSKTPDYVSRMTEERDQLNERLTKLRTFMFSTEHEIDPAQMGYLTTQADQMANYLNVLAASIEAAPTFEAPKPVTFPED